MSVRMLLQIVAARRWALSFILLLLVAEIGLFSYRSSVLKPQVEGVYTAWNLKRRAATTRQPASDTEVYTRGQQDLAVFNGTIPDKRQFVRLVGELYELAANSSLKVGGITYKAAVVKGQPLLAFSVSVAVSGPYAGIKSFIGDVARLKDMIIIDGISLTSSAAQDESVGLKMELTAYMKQGATR